MKEKCCMNPYLPENEFVPDGEPHVFGERLYVYGSHDRYNGTEYCQEPYVCWSAPTDDLADWKYEGVILEKGQDPLDPEGNKNYYAPDAAEGPDGRFYLYYSIFESNVISVAVCDTPAGNYQFYGHVHYPDGTVLGTKEDDPSQFDPAVLADDDGRIYLYSGNCLPVPGFDPGKQRGSFVCELEKDMLTMKTEQKLVTSGTEKCFDENPFFEASSIRKFNGKYYFIYSPLPNVHNLCYAVSDRPDDGFLYQGVLVSNADIVAGDEKTYALNYMGNNHGSVEEVNGNYYVFYHRHTNRSGWNRQGCAEPIIMRDDGTFEQARITSGGMAGVLPASGTFGCSSVCHLSGPDLEPFVPFKFSSFGDTDPYLTLDKAGERQYISNFRKGARAEYRYFEFSGEETRISVICRSTADGILRISDAESGDELAHVEVNSSKAWNEYEGELCTVTGKRSLVFTWEGKGAADLLEFTIS